MPFLRQSCIMKNVEQVYIVWGPMQLQYWEPHRREQGSNSSDQQMRLRISGQPGCRRWSWGEKWSAPSKGNFGPSGSTCELPRDLKMALEKLRFQQTCQQHTMWIPFSLFYFDSGYLVWETELHEITHLQAAGSSAENLAYSLGFFLMLLGETQGELRGNKDMPSLTALGEFSFCHRSYG